MAETGLGYTAIESAVRDAFLAYFSERLTEDSCQVADVDAVFDAIIAKGTNQDDLIDGLVIDFAGGTNRPRQSFGNVKWAWIISGVYMIRYHDNIESQLRTAVTTIPTALQSNPRLSGVTPRAYITEIGEPAMAKLNDISFYLIPFFVEALDRSVLI